MSKNGKKFDGYDKAKDLDKQVKIMLENHPITQENAREWWKFARTIKSSMDILERTVIDQLTDEVIDKIKKEKGVANGKK